MSVKLFVGGLSWDTTEDGLRQAFSEFGDIDSVRILTNRDTGKSRGFGFVEYKEKTAAEDAVQKLNGSELDGRNIKVDFATERGERGDSRRGGDSRGRGDFRGGRGRSSGYDRNSGGGGGRDYGGDRRSYDDRRERRDDRDRDRDYGRDKRSHDDRD